MGKKWTLKEEDMLIEMWGEFSITKIATKTKRTELALITKARELGLSIKDFENQIDGIKIAEFANALGVSSAILLNWRKKNNLTIRSWQITKGKEIKYINLEDFWRWAEENQNQINVKLFEFHTLGAEPAWMKEKRKKNIEQWDIINTRILKDLYEDKISIKDIANYFSCDTTEIKNELSYLKKIKVI